MLRWDPLAVAVPVRPAVQVLLSTPWRCLVQGVQGVQGAVQMMAGEVPPPLVEAGVVRCQEVEVVLAMLPQSRSHQERQAAVHPAVRSIGHPAPAAARSTDCRPLGRRILADSFRSTESCNSCNHTLGLAGIALEVALRTLDVAGCNFVRALPAMMGQAVPLAAT
jgi:hypothetical protein